MLSVISLLGSLQVFDQTSMAALRTKSLGLTAFLEHLLQTRIQCVHARARRCKVARADMCAAADLHVVVACVGGLGAGCGRSPPPERGGRAC